jgi:hypothetical protein
LNGFFHQGHFYGDSGVENFLHFPQTDRVDKISFIGFAPDNAFEFEPFEGVNDRSGADIQPGGQVLIGYLLVRAQFVVVQNLAQALVGFRVLIHHPPVFGTDFGHYPLVSPRSGAFSYHKSAVRTNP